MKRLSVLLMLATLAAVPIASADVVADDLPADTVWYFHVDLAAMRDTDAGRTLYRWLDDEVIIEINEEVGIDVSEEVDRITAFSADEDDYVAIVEGRLSREAQDRMLNLSEIKENITRHEHRGKPYFYGSGARRNGGDRAERIPGYFTFAVPGKMIATSSEDALKALMDSGGKVSGAGAHRDALFVLSADRQFVQAGMRTARFADESGDWKSNILRNTEQAALLVSDAGGLMAVQARLLAKDPALTESLGSIVNGVIALQAFSSEMDPWIADILRNTRVESDGAVLSVSTVVDPNVVVREFGD